MLIAGPAVEELNMYMTTTIVSVLMKSRNALEVLIMESRRESVKHL